MHIVTARVAPDTAYVQVHWVKPLLTQKFKAIIRILALLFGDLLTVVIKQLILLLAAKIILVSVGIGGSATLGRLCSYKRIVGLEILRRNEVVIELLPRGGWCEIISCRRPEVKLLFVHVVLIIVVVV